MARIRMATMLIARIIIMIIIKKKKKKKKKMTLVMSLRTIA